MLAFDGVCAGYGRSEVLREVTAEFGPGLHVVLGPNGAGKTTLFRVGAGVLPPRSGRVRILDQDVHRDPDAKRHVAYLPHRPALHPGLTVRENLEFWARILGMPSGIRQAGIEAALERLGVLDLASRRAGTLSRGQAQRVAAARALLQGARVLLLDEPTAGMDPEAARAMRALMRDLARSGCAILVSTHNLYEAGELGEDVVLLGAGRILARGTAEELRGRLAPRRRVALRVGGDPRSVLARLGVEGTREGSRWVVEVGGDEEVGRLVRALVEAGLEVWEAAGLGSPLEEVYFGLLEDSADA
ncbi:MAG: heme ABC exporter ATP-binding protein CcmA [Armatimonadota bacterium]|nr:heme ABC exporter ATP-binding protein CcmA [Armatimonadota bacterium]MDR7569564.1 heme ABC exporter ATP-binding protein CcmA [Armatimonadota bacterium]MDR7613596.1 heme ABC exporter ATP-binding protein CcmA [Armatimonadota bacterium]